MTPIAVDVITSAGLARAHEWPGGGTGWLVLGHGAGGGVEALDLQAVAAGVRRSGLGVILVEQPWRVAGRRIAPRPAVLDSGWTEVLAALELPGVVLVGGRSAGARVACRTAARTHACGVVALAFPLHPPGRPDSSRAAELEECPVPVIVVQGDRDPFGTPTELERAVSGLEVVSVDGANHALRMGRATGAAHLSEAVDRIVGFAAGLVTTERRE